jgi:hypothetical protein
MDVVEFTWAAPESLTPHIAEDLSSEGAELAAPARFVPPDDERADYETAAFEPLLLIAGAIAIGLLVDKIAAYVRQARHGGAIIDVRNGAVAVRANPAVPASMVIVVDDDGAHQLNEPSANQLEGFLKRS